MAQEADQAHRLPPPGQGVYGISVAAELSGVGAQSLRLYEDHGLLTPDRTAGGTRRYSSDDIDRIRQIAEILATGINLTGIARILALEAENAALRLRLLDPDNQLPR